MWSSDKFSSLENILRINLLGSSDLGGFWVLYGYTEVGEKKELRREALSEGNFDVKYDFDPVSYGVYEGAVEFSVALEGNGEVTKFDLTVPKIEHGARVERLAKFKGDTVAIYDKDGNEVYIPCLPKKVLFVGNSILAGMFNSYGMCATDASRDYAALVSRSILSRSPDTTFRKLHGSVFEHGESPEDFEKWFYTENNILTMLPSCESFTSDLDLIIIQLMDNVNTPEKTTAFKYNAPRFIEEIKARSPRARIIWVYGWYGSRETLGLASEVCEKYKLESIDVSALHTREGEARSGQVSMHPSGNEIIVKDTWISHPGDKGMAAIAEKIIAQLFPQNS